MLLGGYLSIFLNQVWWALESVSIAAETNDPQTSLAHDSNKSLSLFTLNLTYEVQRLFQAPVCVFFVLGLRRKELPLLGCSYGREERARELRETLHGCHSICLVVVYVICMHASWVKVNYKAKFWVNVLGKCTSREGKDFKLPGNGQGCIILLRGRGFNNREQRFNSPCKLKDSLVVGNRPIG